MAHENHKELIRTLNECVSECIHCSTSCSEEKDAQMLAKCVKLNNDCAEICQMAVAYLCRGSENTDSILEECAKVCESCAKECEKHSHLEHCKRCAEVCRKCAEACHQPV